MTIKTGTGTAMPRGRDGKYPLNYCVIMRADVNFTGSPPTRGDGIVNALELLTVAKRSARTTMAPAKIRTATA